MNIINNGNNLIIDNSINDKKDKIEGEENNNIIKDKNESNFNDSKNDIIGNNSTQVDIDKISNNSKKGLFDVINPSCSKSYKKWRF